MSPRTSRSFESWIADCKDDLASVCKGLAKLVVVDIALSRDQDNPQLIFESMNSTGRELTQADLIRNFILMGLEPELQTSLYKKFWRPMEVDFGQDAYGTHFDGFMRHYLTVKTGEIPNVNEVYEAFKDYAALAKSSRRRESRRWSQTFGPFPAISAPWRSARNLTRTLGMAFQDLRELKVDVAYPFLLELYHDYATGVLPKTTSWRRCGWSNPTFSGVAICAIPTNSLNKTFATFTKALKKDRYLESIQAHLLWCLPIAGFPTDEEFRRDIADSRPLQLPQPQLLAAPAGEPRAQGARSGGRIHHRAHPAAEPRTSLRHGRRRSGQSGSGSRRPGFTRSAI